MLDVMSVLGPTLFNGGVAADYVVVVLKNGGFGTKHLLTGKIVPHVLSKLSPEQLAQGIGIPGSPAPLMQFASAGMQAAQAGLAAANLGVGLLNLGVSAWTAWKVHKMDKKLDGLVGTVDAIDGKVDRMSSILEHSVSHLDGLIRGNALMLGLIIENQANLGAGLGLLHRQVADGFRSVHDALQSAEARRQSQELEQQMRMLFAYYETCTREMQQGRQPPTADLRRIIDVSTKLVAWLDTRIGAHRPGAPERLPLMVARAFALRLDIEARVLLDEAPGSRAAEIDRFAQMIQHEVEAVMGNRPAYELATDAGELVEQYVFLRRSLRTSATLVEFGDGRSLPYYPESAMTWDDGLGRVRELVRRQDTPAAAIQLDLQTLKEHQGWERLAGLPRGTSDDHVDVADVRQALGLPAASPLGPSTLRELLAEAPEAVQSARSKIAKEVG
jgi:hypothetical protein